MRLCNHLYLVDLPVPVSPGLWCVRVGGPQFGEKNSHDVDEENEINLK